MDELKVGENRDPDDAYHDSQNSHYEAFQERLRQHYEDYGYE